MNIVFLMDGADLDAFSSSFGLTLLDKDAKILLPDALSETVLLTKKEFEDLLKDKLIKLKDLKDKKIKKVYLTDSVDIEEIFEKLEGYLDKDYQIEVIDHHIDKELDERDNVKYIIEKVGAATTIVVEMLKNKGVDISPDEATILALGIYEDTGSFKYSLTTPRDFYAAAYLVEKGAKLEIVNDILKKGISKEQLDLIKKLTENIQYLNIGGKKIILAVASTRKYIPDISSKIGLIKPFQEADAYFLLINNRNKITIIARSKDKDIDVGDILGYLGGGGHSSAASGKLKSLPVNKVKEYLESIIYNTLIENDRKIEDIVYRDIKIFSPDTRIKDIKPFLDKNNIEFLMVGDKDRNFIGVVEDKTIEEAIKLGQENLKLGDISTEDIITFTPETTLSEAERYLITTEQDYFPVIKKGKIVGMVSRYYLLKEIHGNVFRANKDIFINRKRKKPRILNYSSKLRKYFPEKLLRILKEIGKTAEEMGYKAYLVGGIVRDIVMGNKKPPDIDILIEGDALELLKRLRKKYGYSYSVYDEFFSGLITIKDKEGKLALDFTTARVEEYDHPGAYPKVKKASLQEDLYRRDFTINTLAIDITSGNYGKLIDYFNGLKDIEDKVIRILKPLSFIEDPIRILRAVRFAGRFGFKLGKTTEKLLKLAVNEEVLKLAPRGRIKQELTYILKDEDKTSEILELMNKYKILHQLIPNFSMSEDRKKVLTKLKTLINTFESLYKVKADKLGLYLLALMYHLPYEVSYKILDKYGFLEKEELFEEFYNIKDELKKLPERDSELYRKLKGLNKNTIIFLSAYLDDTFTERVIKIFSKELDKKNILSGHDLKELGFKPSEEMGKILNDVYNKFIDNEIKTKSEAIDYVKKKYKKEEIKN